MVCEGHKASMIDLERLRVFHAVAKHGSVTAAAAQLGISQPAISRQISTLEEQLKIALFHRHTRGLMLTQEGEKLLEAVKDVFSTLIMTEAILSEEQLPRGTLKIACGDGFGAMWLSTHINDFIRKYPQIQVSMMVVGDDEEIDLSVREADIAIRVTPPKDPRLIYVPFLTTSPKLYATQNYLDQAGPLTCLQDLDHHRILTLSLDPNICDNWLLTSGLQRGQVRPPYLTFNNLYGLTQAVRQGIGIASLEAYALADSPELVEVLPHESVHYSPQIQRLMVYPQPLRHSRRISVFRDFLLKKVIESHH